MLQQLKHSHQSLVYSHGLANCMFKFNGYKLDSFIILCHNFTIKLSWERAGPIYKLHREKSQSSTPIQKM